MFSYRHGFHAGNHADVLKHMVLVQMLEHLLQKEKPFWVIDTHAGGGIYDLTSGYATKSAEADSGVNTLWPLRNKKATPEAVKSYLAQVAALNSGDALQWYPGSPQLAAQMLRQGDHLRMYELHPTEIKLLRGHFESVRRGVSIEEADGFGGLRGILPPPPKRGLVHIDPPYEAKEDYKRVLQTLKEAIPRFSTGTYAIWYPEVARMESQQFGGQLRRLGGSLEKVDWLHATLRVKGAEKGGLGLYGSGMFIVNPPWTLYDRLAEALPWLVETLGVDDYAAYTLEAQQS